jgi:hypothetical protein
MKLVRCAFTLIALLPLQASAEEPVDLAVIHRIKAEAFQGSQVMDHLFYLTDVNGPRLSGSPGYRRASEWTVERLKEWGITNAKLEKWGTFGRGWSFTRFEAHLKEPVYAPLPGVPQAWTSGTEGVVVGEVVAAPVFKATERRDRRYLEKVLARIKEYSEEYKGKLGGKIVLITPPPELDFPSEPAGQRYDDDNLASISIAPEPFRAPDFEWPLTNLPEDPKKYRHLWASVPMEVRADHWRRMDRAWDTLNAFLRDEGVLAVLTSASWRGAGATMGGSGGSWEPDAPIPPPKVSLPPEPYTRLSRLVEKEIVVKVELNVEARFHDDDLDGINVVAEIPGGKKKDEIVMLGAHLDSWHAGTGATDNAGGCAIVLEAMRILKAADLKMDRTVRLALWGGEEQGLFGSRGYVKEHFADPVTMKLKREHARLSGYFNIDNGTGKIRGIYLQGNDMVRPIFKSWLAPFEDLGATTITIKNTGGTDHLSFDAVGLPGFQFIQDPLDYDTRTHHTNLDAYDHVQPSDMMQASAILASFVYNTATRPEMLPRELLPKPLPEKKEVEF